MATTDKLAPQMSFGALGKSSDLKKRLLFTLGALVVYRIGTYIPIPGVDQEVFGNIFRQLTEQGGLMGMLNVFSGGAVERMTIFALNIMPYISAAIIMQLMTAISPRLEQLKKEGEVGRKKINQYTRYLTVLLAAFQAYGIAVGLEGASSGAGSNAVTDPGLFFRASTVITLVGGTVFLMWLGEQITARGVGNGISLIIFAGIVATLPSVLAQALTLGSTGRMSIAVLLGLGVLSIVVIAVVVFFERAQRRILVQYPKRQQGNRMYGGEASHIPLKLNTAGVIPAIFASSILFLPATLQGFTVGQTDVPAWIDFLNAYLGRGQPLFLLVYIGMIAFFAFFYTAIVFNPTDTADNLRKYGGFIPGIRPGKNTADYLDFVLTRITTVGALYLCVVCALPEVLIGNLGVPFYLGGTSILIVVTVTMDTIAQIQGHMLAHQYEPLIKKSRLSRGRR